MEALVEGCSFALFALALLAPGWCLARVALGTGDRYKLCLLAPGCAIALALWSVCLLRACGVSPVHYFWLSALCGFALLVAARDGSRPPVTVPRSTGSLVLLAAIILIAGAARFWPLLIREFPLGWDPSFHLIIAGKIARQQALVVDWLPFKDIRLNYPIGSHELVALLAQVTGMPLHRAFGFLMAAVVTLNVAQIQLLTEAATGDRRWALASATAYGFWAVYGSIDYPRWGGLPNAFAMSCWLNALCLWLLTPRVAVRIAATALSFAALVLSHHHVMITAALAYVGVLPLLIVRHRAREALELLGAAALAAGLTAFYVVPYALRAMEITDTSIAQFYEDEFTRMNLWRNVGPLFLVCGSVGLGLWTLRGSGLLRAAQPHVVGTLGMLLLAYLILAVVWPLVQTARGLPPTTPFTPSRFLTDAMYFLCLPVGMVVCKAADRLRLATGTLCGLMIIAGTAASLDNWRQLYGAEPMERSFLGALRWLHAATPAEAAICDPQPDWGHQAVWTTYVAWRPTSLTPIPVSEPVEATPNLETRIADACSGRAPASSLARPLYAIRRDGSVAGHERIVHTVDGGRTVAHIVHLAP